MARSLDVCHFDLGSGGGQKWLLFSLKSTIALSPGRAPNLRASQSASYDDIFSSAQPGRAITSCTGKPIADKNFFPAKTHRRRFPRDGRLRLGFRLSVIDRTLDGFTRSPTQTLESQK